MYEIVPRNGQVVGGQKFGLVQGARNERKLFKSFSTILRETGLHQQGITSDGIIASFERRILPRLLKTSPHLILAKAMMSGNAELVKAIATNTTTSNPQLFPSGSGYGQGLPLLLENLDPMMTAVLAMESHLKIFNSIPRVPSLNTFFEWVRQNSYGTTRRGPGFREGASPQGAVPDFARGSGYVKFMGVRRGVTHQMSLSGGMGGVFTDPEQIENHSGTMELLSMLERWLIWGDKDVKDLNGNEVNYDGLYTALVRGSHSASIIDNQGNPLEPEQFEQVASLLHKRGKLANFDNLKCWMSPDVLADLGKVRLGTERKELTQQVPGGYVMGLPFIGFASQFGFIPFDDSIFLDIVDGGQSLAASEAGVLTAKPGSVTVTPTGVAAGVSQLPAGTYFYFVSSFDDYGETDPVASTSTSISANQKAALSWSKVSSATGYRVYRQDTGASADATKAYCIAQVPQGGATITFDDVNQIRANTGMAVFLNCSPEDFVIAQLTPLIKWPLAIVNTTVEFLLMLYHLLAIKAPERVVIIKNIGMRP